MKKLFAILAFALLLVPEFALAQPPGCTWEGDPAIRFGFGELDYGPGFYNQPGADYCDVYAGGTTYVYTLAPYSSHATWLPAGCKAADTMCFHAVSLQGWAITCTPPMGSLFEGILPGQYWYQEISVTAPCTAVIGDKDTLIAMNVYANNAGVCDPSCLDCNEENVRPSTGVKYYAEDTLIVTVIASPPALGVFQDTLTLVDAGATQAYIPFTLCNQDDCAPPALYNYVIWNGPYAGHIPVINQIGSVSVPGGECKDIYGIINASAGVDCDFDTLRIIVWTEAPVVYDTCVQVIHIINPQPVPLFTVPVVTILVLALILAAAVFMRRRAVSRA